MEKKIEELQSDFQYLIKDLDLNSYNPLSMEFEKAVNIGVMWHILNQMKNINQDILNDEYAEAHEELMGAEKYFNMYKETHDPTLKTMASQECGHANYWLNKIRLMSKDNEHQNKYERLKSWYNNILEQINL